MPQKIIYSDTQQIDNLKRKLQAFMPFLQSLHKCLQNIGIGLNEPEMLKFLHLAKTSANSTGNGVPQMLQSSPGYDKIGGNIKTAPENPYINKDTIDYLKSKLIERANAPVVSGLTLNKEKLKELLELPDLSELGAILTYNNMGLWADYSKTAGFGKEGDLIELGSNGYYVVGNADEIIAEKWTYRTKTDKGDKFLQDLQKICDSLNAFDHSYKAIEIDTTQQHSPIKRLPTGELVPSYEFISAYE